MKKTKCAVLAAFMSVCSLLTGCDNGTASVSEGSLADSAMKSSAVSAPAVSSDVLESSDIPASEESSASTIGDNTSAPSQSANVGFKVEGAKLLDANGNEFVMRGINHAHAWFRDELDTSLKAIAATGANCVRVVLSNGNLWDKISRDEVEDIIEKCEQNKLVAVLEVHDATAGASSNGRNASDDIADLQLCADYWIEMKDLLNEHTDTVIVNIANEWHNASWTKPADWADGYKTVIPKLRGAGIENTLMVDADGSGQLCSSLFGDPARDPKGYAADILAADSDKNTMFSVHIYEAAGETEEMVKRNLDGCVGTGVCFVVGEFADTRSPRKDNVADLAVTEYCVKNGIGYIAWSWKGNTPEKISSKETLPFSVMDISEQWDGSKLSDKWGENIINGENGIRKNSEICSVFDQ